MSVRILVSFICDLCGANEQYVVTGRNARHQSLAAHTPDGWWMVGYEPTDVCPSCWAKSRADE